VGFKSRLLLPGTHYNTVTFEGGQENCEHEQKPKLHVDGKYKKPDLQSAKGCCNTIISGPGAAICTAVVVA
jgi:hypothetical protein